MLIGCYRLNDGEWKRFDIIVKTPSIIWTRRFFEHGSFQLQVKNNPLQPYDIIVQGENAGIVLKVETVSGVINVYGYDLKGIASFRKFSAETVAETQAETKIKEWATNYLATGKKAVEALSVAPEKGIETMLPAADLADVNFADLLAEQCKAVDLGWDITFQNGQLVFDLYEPRDKTDNIFSRRHRTLEDTQRIIDHYDEVNVTADEGDVSGIRRREGNELSAASDFMTGVSKPNVGDVRLGDYVTVEDFGVAAKLQITELKYVYEPNNVIVVPSFGEVKKNIIKKLLKG
jgi:hypothetical protein